MRILKKKNLINLKSLYNRLETSIYLYYILITCKIMAQITKDGLVILLSCKVANESIKNLMSQPFFIR